MARSPMKPKLSTAQIKALSTHLGGKPITRKTTMPPMKAAPAMDAEDLIDGGADEATEKS